MSCEPYVPFVSVVIPAFNNQSELNTCLAMMARQSYPMHTFEVIVVDNGSTPPLGACGSYPFNLRVTQCSKKGSYAARNVGAHLASGDVLAFIDADCEPDTEWLYQGVCALARVEDAEFFVGGEVSIREPSSRNSTALYQYSVGFQQRENIEHKYFTATANMFCTKAQFSRVGAFDERLLSGGDREWAWRAKQKGYNVRYEPKAIVATKPRDSVSDAIRQARRVAAGRSYLKANRLAHLGCEALAPHQSMATSLKWILTRDDLSKRERGKILTVAIIIKSASVIELLRLRLGGNAERR